MPAFGGEIADPGAYNRDTRKLVARGSRGTNSSTTTTTEIGVLRIDSAPLKAGRAYEIVTSTLLLGSTVGTDEIWSRLRVSTTGTAEISSTELAFAKAQNGSGSVVLRGTRYPASDETLSVLLSVIRNSGSGNVSIFAGTNGMTVEIYDMGTDTGNVGVSL